MFIEQLTTPCQGAGDTSFARPLLEALDNIGADHRQSDYDGDVELAYKVASTIRHSLRFRRDRGDLGYLEPAALAGRPVTNCHGFTIVTSEALQHLNIDHYVGFSNHHSFVLTQDPKSGQTNLIDTSDKPLCTDITGALAGGKRLGEADEGRGTIHRMLGSEILKSAVFENDMPDSQQRDWLSFSRKSGAYSTKSGDPEGTSDDLLLLRSYHPEQGRQVILNFNQFRHAILVGQMATAHLFFSKMSGIYPEIDRRNKFAGPTELIKFLGRGCFSVEAMEDIDAAAQSLADFSEDFNFKLWPIDRRRDIANYMRDKNLLQSSVRDYENLAGTIPKLAAGQKLIAGKIRKTKQLIDKIRQCE